MANMIVENIDNMIVKNIDNMINFISKIKLISNNKKENTSYSDNKKKKINDLFTEIMNEFLVVEPDLLYKYLEIILEIFNDFDSDNLNIKNPTYNNNNNNYDLINNLINEPNNTLLKGFFVFKGGNIIKIWTLNKVMNKLFLNTDNIGDLLKFKIDERYDSNKFNSYSDYDFQYYITGDTYDNKIYQILIEHVIRRFDILRNDIINSIFTDNIKNKLLPVLNNKLLADVKKHFNIDEIERITFSQNINSLIITKYPEPHATYPKYTFYELKEKNKSIPISFNNTIITNLGIDFDLYRLKINFDLINSNNNFCSSELFDLSILRPSDESRNEFCKNINENTNIIIFNNEKLKIRIYSIILIAYNR